MYRAVGIINAIIGLYIFFALLVPILWFDKKTDKNLKRQVVVRYFFLVLLMIPFTSLTGIIILPHYSP